MGRAFFISVVIYYKAKEEAANGTKERTDSINPFLWNSRQSKVLLKAGERERIPRLEDLLQIAW